MNHDLSGLTIAEAGRLFRAKELSPVELTDALLARIEVVDPLIHSYLLVTADVARAQAKAAETEIMAGEDKGPLHGIPYALKDNIDTAGIVTTGNSRLLIDHVPEKDATVTAKLKAAGGVLMGKTALREFAMGVRHDDLPWPYPLNPWNREHEFAGGSSTGSAAAVAAHLALGAIGTDTGGSIRNPAGFCGIVGVKPTYGRISRQGVIPNTFSTDQCGPMAWTVEDCALMLNAISGFDPLDPGSIDQPVPDFTADLGKGVEGLRIGVIRHFYEDLIGPDNEMRLAFEAALAKLVELGAEIRDVTVSSLEAYNHCRTLISKAEFYATHERDLKERPELFGPKLVRRASVGMLVSAADYLQAQRQRTKLTREMLDAFDGLDAMVTLTTIDPAPRDDPSAGGGEAPSLTRPFSLTGLPAISVPTGLDGKGLPLAMQVAGKAFDEQMVFRIAQAYEQATSWHEARPELGDAVAA